jgi:hypothetical protein
LETVLFVFIFVRFVCFCFLFGRAPWMIVRADVALSVANPALKTARALDANGTPVKDIPLEQSAGRAAFRFPADALYVVLQ